MSFYDEHFGKLIITAVAAGIFLVKYILDKVFTSHQKWIVIQSVDDWNLYGNEILQTLEVSGVVGIDCEWVTSRWSGRMPISLLQLADCKGFCVLIRLSRIPVYMMPGLCELLKDKDIIKVGVGVHDDALKLYSDYYLQVQNFLDLRYLFKDLPEMQSKPLGLKSLAKEILNYDLKKNKFLSCSDWDSENLTYNQIKYAADDAIIAAKLFENIKSRKSKWLSYQFCFEKDIEIYLDVPFKQTGNNSSLNKLYPLQW